MAGSTYAATKKYLERKYNNRVFLTFEEVQSETLGEACMIPCADNEEKERFLIADVAAHISREVKDKKTHRAQVIATYCLKLHKYWIKHHF